MFIYFHNDKILRKGRLTGKDFELGHLLIFHLFHHTPSVISTTRVRSWQR